MLKAKYQSEKTLTAHIFGLVFWTDIQSTFLEIFGQRPLSLKIPNVKVFDITVPPAENVCWYLTSNNHLHVIVRPHFNIEFDFDVSLRTCMMLTVTSKSNLMLGRFSDRVLWRDILSCLSFQLGRNVNKIPFESIFEWVWVGVRRIWLSQWPPENFFYNKASTD